MFNGEIVFQPKLTFTRSSFADHEAELLVGSSVNPRVWSGLNSAACQGYLSTSCVWEIPAGTRSRFTIKKFLTSKFQQYG